MAPTGVALLDDPAKTKVGRRKQFKELATMSDEQIKDLSPEQIKDMVKTGADLNDHFEPNTKDSSLKIRIELDLEVEVHLSATVQGDITIGLL